MENNTKFKLIFKNAAEKDLKIITKNRVLVEKTFKLLNTLETNGPFQNPPPFEQLQGEYKGYYSRRLNKKDRLVYSVEDNKIIIYSLLSHYEHL